MPALASNCPSRSPDGPEPTITICVRISNPYFKSNESKRVSENWALTARIVRLQRAYTSCRVVELVATSRSLQLLAQFPQYPIARQHLFNASVGFAALADCCKELAVLQLDAVHRYVDLADVDLLVLAGIEIVVAGDVGRHVADVAEERAKRAVVIERQRQRTDRAILRLELDAHVHRDAERGTDRALKQRARPPAAGRVRIQVNADEAVFLHAFFELGNAGFRIDARALRQHRRPDENVGKELRDAIAEFVADRGPSRADRKVADMM